ncbi:sulfurtransferase complex subunit TusC [Vibrio hippocampi]|uniref:Protein TusC homolog n=1 Tax=Vibrio hippocampi TaxID=654686 RepID=A0ABM8ZDV3_9VIBR|nr:sulfurtransferase complex subunit TusC [Vibrio hippocampi]CAH0524484.1 Protein TusC [Vibrio hippocampi]
MLGFVFHSLPHSSSSGREGLDALLATSAFTEDIKVFFIAGGVNQLRKGQQAETVLSKDYISAYRLLELYDIEQIYICEQSLNQYGLTLTDCVIEGELLSHHAITAELSQCSKVVSF